MVSRPEAVGSLLKLKVAWPARPTQVSRRIPQNNKKAGARKLRRHSGVSIISCVKTVHLIFLHNANAAPSNVKRLTGASQINLRMLDIEHETQSSGAAVRTRTLAHLAFLSRRQP